MPAPLRIIFYCWYPSSIFPAPGHPIFTMACFMLSTNVSLRGPASLAALSDIASAELEEA
jgi:hypothetical protein